MKKFLSILLAVTMLLSMMSFSAVAEEVNVASVDGTPYTDLTSALKALQADSTLTLLSDITSEKDWPRTYFDKPVTIEGNNKTIKIKAGILDQNYSAVFRFNENAVVKDLTIDLSETTKTGLLRAVSSAKNASFYNCHFIGNGSTYNTRAIIFGETTDPSTVSAKVEDCTFTNWRRAISVNENAKNADTVIVTESSFTDSGIVRLNGATKVEFTNNKMTNSWIDVYSENDTEVKTVIVTGNTLEKDSAEGVNVINSGLDVTTQDEMTITKKGSITVGYTSKTDIWGELTANARESIEILIYAGDEKIAKTNLNNIGGIIDGNVTVTWHNNFVGNFDEYWTTEWYNGHPLRTVQPTKVVLVVDGVEVAENVVKMTSPDNIHDVVWEELAQVAGGNFDGYAAYGISAPLSDTNDREKFAVDIYHVTARESVAVKSYYGNELLATTTLRSTDRDDLTPINLPVDQSLTANIVISGRLSGSWDTEWHVTPNVTAIPDKFELVIDGVVVDTIIDEFTDAEKADWKALTGTEAVAKIGDVEYGTLKYALDAANAGDTIVLISDVEDETGTKIEKDITIDLNKFTYTSTGASCNNRCFLISGEADVTIKNGTIIAKGETVDNTIWGAAAGTGAYGSVRMDSTGTLNLTDITTYNYRGWGANVKACAGKTICTNVNIFANVGGGFEAAGGEVILNNCNVDQKGTFCGPFNSAAASVSTNGSMTINGGTYTTASASAADALGQGTTHGPMTLMVMNSGGTMTINDGVFSNDNYGDNALATAARSVIHIGALQGVESKIIINGGTFTSLSDKVATFEGGDGTQIVSISGGQFNVNPSDYLAEGYRASKNAAGYVVVNDDKITESIYVMYEDVTPADATEEKVYGIVVKANKGDVINQLETVDLLFNLTGTPLGDGELTFTVRPAEGFTMSQTGKAGEENRYMFNYSTLNGKWEGTAEAITVGYITVGGYGEYAISTNAEASTNIVNATTYEDSLVDFYTANGAADNNSATGALIIGKDDITTDEYLPAIDGVEIKVPTYALTINIDFNNPVEKNAAAYQDMKVEITGGVIDKELALGNENYTEENVDYPVTVTQTAKGYVLTANLPYNTSYAVTVSGAGYRTAFCDNIKLTEAKTVRFWNNVMSDKNALEVLVGSGKAVTKNFLAGEVVKDGEINIYDLSAVVSYFGQTTDKTAYSKYAKYDLNRDGVIDSKDVAYVLVSWNE